MVFNTVRGTTYLFGGTVRADPTYGPQEFWEYLPNARRGRTAPAARAAMAASCMSGNCVDGVCCAQTAAQCSGHLQVVQRRREGGDLLRRPRRAARRHLSVDQACDANQQCKTPARAGLRHVRGLRERQLRRRRLLRHAPATTTCKACNLAGKRGTCSYIAVGRGRSVADPACVSSSRSGPRQCDGNGNCMNGKQGDRQALHGGRPVRDRLLHRRLLLQQQLRADLLPVRPGRRGRHLRRDRRRPGQTTARRRPCDAADAVLQRLRHLRDQQEAERRDLRAPPATAAAATASTAICCNSACTGTCQSCAVPGASAPASTSCRARRTRSPPRRAAAAQYCDAGGTCQSGAKPNGATCARRQPSAAADFCVDGVCCTQRLHRRLLRLQPAGQRGHLQPDPTGGVDTNGDDDLRGAATTATAHACTTGKKPNGAVCGGDLECGSNFCVDGTCCECVVPRASAGPARTPTGTCVLAADGMDPRNDCVGRRGVCARHLQRPGGLPLRPQGTDRARRPAARSDRASSPAAGTCDGAGHCSATTDQGLQRVRLLHRRDRGWRSAETGLHPECAIELLPRAERRRHPRRRAGWRRRSQCPPAFDLGHACTRNTQCLSGTCSDGVCCNVNCDKCGSCNRPRRWAPASRSRPAPIRRWSAWTTPAIRPAMCKGFCNGQAALHLPGGGHDLRHCARPATAPASAT